VTKHFVFLAIFCRGVFSHADDTNIVHFGDSRVNSAMCVALEVPNGSELTRAQCLQVTNLLVDGSGILSLDGVQYASNLTFVAASLAEDVSIEPMKTLPRLRHLDLFGSALSDVSAFIDMTNLLSLTLGGSPLTNASLIARMTNLIVLSLCHSELTNLSFLSSLTNLETLYLSDNRIQNIDVLGGLTKLSSLSLSNNHITNILRLIYCPLVWLEVGRNFLMETNHEYTADTWLVVDQINSKTGYVDVGYQGIWGTIRLSIAREPEGLRVSWIREPPQTAFHLWFATDGERSWAIDPDFFVNNSFFFEINERAETQWFWTELRVFEDP
jgi:hypothetical protein